MSGDVAKRLFDLLPRRMPLQMKFSLVKKLWDHFCPTSSKTYYIGRNPNLKDLDSKVSVHFQKQVQDYYIAPALAERFNWLAAGDVRVKQDLENYFQELKKHNIAEALGERLRVLQEHLGNYSEDQTIQVVKIGNHVLKVKFSDHANGVAEEATVTAARQVIRKEEEKKENLKRAFWFVFWIVVAVCLLKACAR